METDRCGRPCADLLLIGSGGQHVVEIKTEREGGKFCPPGQAKKDNC